MVTLVEPAWVEANIDGPHLVILDPRSRVKYLQGHLKNAVDLPIAGAFDGQGRLQPPDRLAAAGIGRGDGVIAYCRSGPRAAVGYLALQQLGRRIRLYDGSYAEWARQGLPAAQEVVSR